MKATMVFLMILATMFLTSQVIASPPLYEIKPAYPDYSRPYGEAGSTSNPYQVRQNNDGQIEIRSKYPDYSQPYGTPGSPSNPYKVTPIK